MVPPKEEALHQSRVARWLIEAELGLALRHIDEMFHIRLRPKVSTHLLGK